VNDHYLVACLKKNAKFRRGKISCQRLGKEYDETRYKESYWRPTNRLECVDGLRPCPYISCQYHLYLDVEDNGTIILNFKDVPPDRLDLLKATCALDVADEGENTLESAGEYMNLTRERIRQIERGYSEKLRKNKEFEEWKDVSFADLENHAVTSELWAPGDVPGKVEMNEAFYRCFGDQIEAEKRNRRRRKD